MLIEKQFEYIPLHVEKQYALRLNQGALVMESLKQFALKENIQFAFVQGIGALTDINVASFNVQTKEYAPIQFKKDSYELTSALGNITWIDDQPFPHLHVQFGVVDGHNENLGGHLLEGTVSVTVELNIVTYKQKVYRDLIPQQCAFLKTWTFHN